MMKVIYSECNDRLWIDVAAILQERSEWEPCYWVGNTQFEHEVKQRFGEICFHSTIDAVKSVPSPAFAPSHPVVLDQPILEELAACESAVLKMMDRMEALGSFSYSERIRHYHRLVTYWLSVIETYQPDVVFFWTIPHMVYDYILYQLCKRAGIPTLMFEVSIALGLSYLRDSVDGETRLEQLYKRLLEENRYEQEIVLTDALESYLNSMSGSYDDVPLYIRFVSKKELYIQNWKTYIQKLFDFENNARYFQKQFNIIRSKLRTPINYIKQSGKLPEHSGMTYFEYRQFRSRVKRQVKKLDQHYHRLTTQHVDLERPYIFVALSYQPEATTSPKGDVFVNMLLMVEMLSKLLPEGWTLYVKEHPAQFDESWAFRAHVARQTYFYDDLAALENVRLVPTTFSSYSLMDHAIAVATVTGTVGWQAVIRAKPVLVFGHPWYRGCEGVLQVNTQEKCQQALAMLQSGFQVDPHKVRLYARALERVGVNLDFEDKMKYAQLSDIANAQSIAAAIANYF